MSMRGLTLNASTELNGIHSSCMSWSNEVSFELEFTKHPNKSTHTHTFIYKHLTHFQLYRKKILFIKSVSKKIVFNPVKVLCVRWRTFLLATSNMLTFWNVTLFPSEWNDRPLLCFAILFPIFSSSWTVLQCIYAAFAIVSDVLWGLRRL